MRSQVLTVLQLGHFDEWSHARWKQGRQNLHNGPTVGNASQTHDDTCSGASAQALQV
jgi:hypothetical protein